MQRGTKSMESLLAQTAFDAAKQGLNNDPAELLLGALLRESGSIAREILLVRLTAQELREIQEYLEARITTASSGEEVEYEHLFLALRKQLHRRFWSERTLTTAHLLSWILEQPTIVSERLRRLGVHPAWVLRSLKDFGTFSPTPLESHPLPCHDLDALFQGWSEPRRVNLNPSIR